MGKTAFRYLCALLAILFASCSKEDPLDKMEHIKMVGNDHPKQALAMLDSLEQEARRGSVYAQKKYDLLHIRLSDKANILPKSDAKIKELVEYFGKKGSDQEKLAKSQQAKFPVIKPYRDQIENKYQWCIAAVPGEAWAKKLFPGLRKTQAVEKLWEAILSTSRALEGDPQANWAAHNKDIHDRRDYLNSLHIRQLRYRSATGTDFTVGMIPEAHFCGGSERSLQGIVFNPNIPSEECFISPKRGEAEGIVYATKPLSYQGQLIDKFWIRFHAGKAVEWHAEQNNALLTKLITMDEGSAYLGECALVPYDSPIRQSGLLFYNTLFDENAACHLALGMGVADTINDFEHKTLAECRALGVNDSMIHEDFMIGSEDMDIDAVCENGDVVPVFRHGNWAF